MSDETYCRWIKAKKVKCRFPKEDTFLACIACLFGWHLELSELKQQEKEEKK